MSSGGLSVVLNNCTGNGLGEQILYRMFSHLSRSSSHPKHTYEADCVCTCSTKKTELYKSSLLCCRMVPEDLFEIWCTIARLKHQSTMFQSHKNKLKMSIHPNVHNKKEGGRVCNSSSCCSDSRISYPQCNINRTSCNMPAYMASLSKCEILMGRGLYNCVQSKPWESSATLCILFLVQEDSACFIKHCSYTLFLSLF